MDVWSRLRLVLGPVRPFLWGKITDGLRLRRSMRRLKARASNGPSRTPVRADLHLRGVVVPFPSPVWCDDHRHELLAWADRVAEGRVSVYGIEMPPNGWNVDPYSGYTWPASTWFADCVLAMPDHARPRGIDIRIPHEYGRCHHWPALALAAALAPERREVYADALRRDVRDFLDRNPPQHGPQWTITTGVAIRAANLALACDWLRAGGTHDRDFEHLVAAALVDHAEHIEATLEWAGGMRTSHYLANLLGLLAVGIYVQGHPRTRAWCRMAEHGLTREWETQFLDDGMSFEASTGYHRHVVDIMVLAAMFIEHGHAAEAGLIGPLSDVWCDRIERSVAALQAVLVNGRIDPAIGDDDDGMAIKLLSYEPDVSWLLDSAAMLGEVAPPMPWTYHGLPNFGLHLWHHGRVRASMRCGPIGQWGKGGHAHNDQLAVTFGVDGHRIIADPGIVCYGADPERRDRDRSTAAHATLAPVGIEQNDWPSGAEGMFWMFPDRTRAFVADVHEHGIEARHSGFGRPHVRRMNVDRDGIRVEDQWDGMPAHPADIMLPCAPGVDVVLHADHATLAVDHVRCTVHWEGAQGHVDGAVASAGFARSVDTVTLRLRATASVVRWSVRIVP